MTVKLTATHESYCTKTYILIADVIMNNITYVTVVPFPWASVYFADGLMVCGGACLYYSPRSIIPPKYCFQLKASVDLGEHRPCRI